MTFRIVAVFSAVFFTIAGFFSAALAVGENVFVVPRVAVQAQADSATAAKNAAQSRGRRRAMDILLRRLTMEEDWIYLPRLTTGEEASAPANGNAGGKRAIVLSARDLELLESGFEVNNEKSSSQTYRAFITYRFKPTSVRKLFKDAGIPYSEAQTRTALVLPVLQTTNGLYLWENNNPWMAAWKIRPYNNELTPMAAPLGDLEDESVVTARQALALNQESMRKMAARYSVSQVIVAHAFLEQSDGEDKLRVRLVNAFRESGVLAPLEELGPDQQNFADANPNANSPPLAEAVSAAKVGDVLAEAWFTRPSGNFPVLAEDAIETAIAKYSKDWKSRTLIDHSAAAILEASAYFRSIGEWTKIRSALVGTPLVGSVQVRALSRQGAEMLIRTYGDPNKLVIAMEAQGLALWSEDGLTWLIATPETAQQVRGRDRRRRRAGEGGNYSGIRPASQPASQIESIDGAESKIEQPY